MPGNSLDTEIRDFKNEVEHPEDWTDSELTAVAVHRRQSDFSHTEISDRVGISRSVVKRGRQKLVHTNLADEADIHEAFQECTTTQQTVIAASLAPTAYTTTEITEMADCATNTVHSTRQLSKPLMRKLDAVGLPDRLIPAAIRNDSTESDENNDTDETATDDEEPATETTTSDTSPTNETTPEPTTSRQAIEDIRRFVTGLRERATDSARSESPPARQRTAREATCEAILAYIETVDKQIEREPSR